MITGWLVKIVLTIGVLGFAVIEGGSPLVTRAQLDDVAHEVADEAARELLATRDVDQSRATAEQVATDKDAALKEFQADSAGVVRVTVEREARSFLWKKWDRTESWYDVEVSATSGEES